MALVFLFLEYTFQFTEYLPYFVDEGTEYVSLLESGL